MKSEWNRWSVQDNSFLMKNILMDTNLLCIGLKRSVTSVNGKRTQIKGMITDYLKGDILMLDIINKFSVHEQTVRKCVYVMIQERKAEIEVMQEPVSAMSDNEMDYGKHKQWTNFKYQIL